MPNPSVTYTFTASTSAQSAQVNQNFTDLINAMIDGTKSFNIAALAATTGTFSGALVATTGTFTGVITSSASSASDVAFTLDNTNSSNAAAHADLIARTASGGGDPYFRFIATGVGTWSLGQDRSDSGKFKISFGSDLTGADVFNCTVGGVATFGTQLIAKGTATNDSAATGYIGEYVESIISSAANFTATGVFEDMTSISLTAGDWDVSVMAQFVANASTSTSTQFGIGTAAGALTTGLVTGVNTSQDNAAVALLNLTTEVPRVRMSIAGTTTVYLKCVATFSAGTPQRRGIISARRLR